MKIQKLIVTFIILSFLSCSKDDDAVVVEANPESPMKSLIADGVMELKNTKINSPNHHELGYKFKTFKNGRITALGIRVPDNDTYRVTLWNMDTEEILKTVEIESTAGFITFQDINPVNIQSGTAYFVSLNTNDYYAYNDGGDPIFPVESNNILVIGYGAKYGTNQELPPNIMELSYLGMVDIKFVPNN